MKCQKGSQTWIGSLDKCIHDIGGKGGRDRWKDFNLGIVGDPPR
jgi:hypothetical protein